MSTQDKPLLSQDDEIKCRLPKGSKNRLRAIAKAKSRPGYRSITMSDEVRTAIENHLNNMQHGKKAA